MLKVARSIYYFFVLIVNSNKGVIIYEAYRHEQDKTIKKNWGDDLNKHFFEYSTGKKTLLIPFSDIFNKRRIHYSLIGSIIGHYNLDNTIIYGSGIMNRKDNSEGKPIKIISVRGPLTRRFLLSKGIACPEKYGDPALLLPLFYKPNIQKKCTVGIIPHEGTYKHPDVLLKYKNYTMIDLCHYKDWKSIIDQICSCDYIISESLHGLIVATTYGIPNVWIEIIKHPDFWNDKFLDFYESLGINNMESVKLYNDSNSSIEQIKIIIDQYKKPEINYKDLLDLFPFDISQRFTN